MIGIRYELFTSGFWGYVEDVVGIYGYWKEISRARAIFMLFVIHFKHYVDKVLD